MSYFSTHKHQYSIYFLLVRLVITFYHQVTAPIYLILIIKRRQIIAIIEAKMIPTCVFYI